MTINYMIVGKEKLLQNRGMINKSIFKGYCQDAPIYSVLWQIQLMESVTRRI